MSEPTTPPHPSDPGPIIISQVLPLAIAPWLILAAIAYAIIA